MKGYICVQYNDHAMLTSWVPFRWLAVLLVWTIGTFRGGGRFKVVHCSGVVVYERVFE